MTTASAPRGTSSVAIDTAVPDRFTVVGTTPSDRPPPSSSVRALDAAVFVLETTGHHVERSNEGTSTGERWSAASTRYRSAASSGHCSDSARCEIDRRGAKVPALCLVAIEHMEKRSHHA
jgi:hypothetical protein